MCLDLQQTHDDDDKYATEWTDLPKQLLLHYKDAFHVQYSNSGLFVGAQGWVICLGQVQGQHQVTQYFQGPGVHSNGIFSHLTIYAAPGQAPAWKEKYTTMSIL